MFAGTIDLLRQATAFAARRHELLAQNVANAETPGFQARDLAFDRELTLAQRVRALPWYRSASSDQDVGGPSQSRVAPPSTVDSLDVDVRMVESPDARMRPDGNNVDIDRQMARVAQNTLYHNVVVQLLTSRFNALKSAINGRA
jgi:flagellar basal-body rod protein FlgB